MSKEYTTGKNLKMPFCGDYKAILLDVGNTKTKVRLLGTLTKKDFTFPTKELPEKIKKLNPNTFTVISSVVKEATIILKQHFKNVLFVSPQIKLPVKINYQTPLTLGADRIAHACGGLNYANSFIVINSGTALVIDIIENKTFQGGWILPGITSSFKCLHLLTSSLPQIEKVQQLPYQIPGKSTKECITKGVLLSIISIIYKLKTNYNLPLIITGGEGKVIYNSIKREIKSIIYAKDLTLQGLEKIYEINFER